MDILITYLAATVDDELQTLGTERSNSISHLNIPSHEPDRDVTTYLHKRFSGQKNTEWCIENVEIGEDNRIVVKLSSPPHQLSSIGGFAKDQNKHVNHFITKYSLVNVHYGYKSMEFEHGSKELSENCLDTSRRLPSEMWKMRPCIVLDFTRTQARIIPLTSTTPNDQRVPYLEISAASYNGLNGKYSAEPSYALVNMMHTVSVHRLYPMKIPLKPGKPQYAHDCRKFKLCSDDTKRLRDTLGSVFASDTHTDLTNLNTRHLNLLAEKAAMRKAIATLEAQKQLTEAKIADLGAVFGFSGAADEVLDQLEQDFNS